MKKLANLGLAGILALTSTGCSTINKNVMTETPQPKEISYPVTDRITKTDLNIAANVILGRLEVVKTPSENGMSYLIDGTTSYVPPRIMNEIYEMADFNKDGAITREEASTFCREVMRDYAQ